jgi:cysteine-rich repeat protein
VLVLFAAGQARGALIEVIQNGLTPPNPANVIDANDDYSDSLVYVDNVGCNYAVGPCPSPGDSTTIALVPGGAVAYDMAALNSSSLVMTGGSIGGGLQAFDSSSIAVSGGAVQGFIDSYASSSILVSGGALAGRLNAYGSSSIIIFGTGFEVGYNGFPLVPVGYGPLPYASTPAAGDITGTLQSGESLSMSFTYIPGATITLAASSFCGDGLVDASRGEACDDQNTTAADGCSATCVVESGWRCAGQPAGSTLRTYTARGARYTISKRSITSGARSLGSRPMRRHSLAM